MRWTAPRGALAGGGGALHRRRLVWLVAAAGAAAIGVVAVRFVRRAEVLLGRIPAQVQVQLRREGSTFVPLRQIPLTLQDATIAVEDRSYWSNIGISFQGIGRAALVDLRTRSFAQGGSTITQQLVRDQLLSPRKTIPRKLRGVAYSILLTLRLPKSEILALYFNEVNYGGGNFGIAAAARHYFGVSPSRLSAAQTSLLAGLPQDPALYDPQVHLREARGRQQLVLQSLVAAHYLSPAAAQATFAAPLHLLPRPKAAAAGAGGAHSP